MKTLVEKIDGVQRFYMPYMTMETLEALKASGQVLETGHYSMYEYKGDLQLAIFDRHYSIAE